MKRLMQKIIIGAALIMGVPIMASATLLPNNSNAQSVITGNAFANTGGIIAINQAAGISNTEANAVNIVMGASKPVSNSVLAQNLSSVSNHKVSEESENLNTVAVGATAFKGAGGIAQINQVSGSGNASANSFALGIAPGMMH